MSLINKNENLEKQLVEQNQNVEENNKEDEQKRQLEGLNNLLFSTISEYTKIRNEHAKMLEQQLCPIRCDIERRIRSTDLDNFDKNKMSTVCSELLTGLLQKGHQFSDLCEAIKMSSENINQLKLCFSEWKKESGKIPKGFGLISSSFDIQKRLERIENHYDKSLSDFERLKNDLDNLDKHLKFDSNLIEKSSTKTNDVLRPLAQHQLIRTNDNITKIYTKLETKIRQIRTLFEEKKNFEEKNKKDKINLKYSGDAVAASFCVLKLEQLNLFDDNSKIDVNEEKMILSNSSTNFGQNLFNFFKNHDQYKKPLESNCIRKIQPIRPTCSSIKEKEQKLNISDEQKLKNVLLNEFKQQKKPQVVSIGVQSPDHFLAKTTTLISSSTQKVNKNVEKKKKIICNYSPSPSIIITNNNNNKNVSLPSTNTNKNIINITSSSSPSSVVVNDDLLIKTTTKPKTLLKENENEEKEKIQKKQKEGEEEKKEKEKKEEKKKEDFGINLTKNDDNQNTKNNKLIIDEGMEDEAIVAMGPIANNNNNNLTTTSKEEENKSTISNFNFNLGLGATSTPINNKNNPFGSIISSTKPFINNNNSASLFGNNSNNNAFGSSINQQQQQNSGAFGSFDNNTIINSGSTGGFGSSPFASATAPSFGASPIFGKATSPFASNNVISSSSSSPFGDNLQQNSSISVSKIGATNSMFGGGINNNNNNVLATTATGFSSFASKSTAFGQLAAQQQQQSSSSSSLFGGGADSVGTTKSFFGGGFGGTSNIGIKPAFGQQKSSAFTTFRK